MDAVLAFLGDYTVRTVLLGALMLGAISGALGAFAVLRRQSLLGDALSHAALPGVCLGFLLSGTRAIGPILLGALATGALAAVAVVVLTRRSRLKTDAAIGATLSVGFAIGVVLLTLVQRTGNASQGGLDSFLFGQAAALLREDLVVMAAIGAVALALVLASWKEAKLVAFDPGFAGSVGLPVTAIETGLTLLIALAIVIGLQMVGVVLMSAMLIAPAAAARQWTRTLEGMVLLSAALGMTGGVAGALISATARNVATGPVVVLVLSVLVVASLLFAPGRGLLWDELRRRRARRALRARLERHGLGAAGPEASR